MSLVLNALRNKSEMFKNRDADSTPLISAPTDFTIFDYLNTERGNMIDNRGNQQLYLNSGLVAGVHSAIGKSMSGKTSLFVKLGAAIVSKFPNSTFYYRDVEKSTSIQRIREITGLTDMEISERIDYKRYEIDHNFVYNELRTIAQYKENLKDQIMIDTGLVNAFGKPVKIYPPDVYLVDSLPALSRVSEEEEIKEGTRAQKIEDVKDADVNRKVEGMQAAGDNKMLLTKSLDIVHKYNIRFILINHISTNMKPGENPRYIQKESPYLKQGDHLQGGAAYLYLCNSITRTDFVSRLDEGEFGPMIQGATRNRITMVKNKSNVSGIPIELIFDQRSGYNSLLSNFNYIYNRQYGYEGNPRSMYLKACPSITFTKRNLWEMLVKNFKENPEKPYFVLALIETARRCLFYDMVLGKPDENPNNWTTGHPTAISYIDGVKS